MLLKKVVVEIPYDDYIHVVVTGKKSRIFAHSVIYNIENLVTDGNPQSKKRK